MGTYFKILCLLLHLIFVLSCATQSTLPPPERAYKSDAIRLHLKADPKLNFHDGMPHTLHVCVYQLRDPNAFNQLANDNDGLYELLECNLFDAVVSSKSLTVRPGQDLKVTLDRAEGAKYVAVVAGYYLIRKKRIVRLFKIPVLQKRKGVLWLTKYSELGDLEITLPMGPKQIQPFDEKDGGSSTNPMQLEEQVEEKYREIKQVDEEVEDAIQTPGRIKEQVKEVPKTFEKW